MSHTKIQSSVSQGVVQSQSCLLLYLVLCPKDGQWATIVQTTLLTANAPPCTFKKEANGDIYAYPMQCLVEECRKLCRRDANGEAVVSYSFYATVALAAKEASKVVKLSDAMSR